MKKIFTYQKKVARVIFLADRLARAKPLMPDMNALNFYQINIYQNLILPYKAHAGTTPLIFFKKFSKTNHNYLTSSKNSGNYSIPKSTMKFVIVIWCPNFYFLKNVKYSCLSHLCCSEYQVWQWGCLGDTENWQDCNFQVVWSDLWTVNCFLRQPLTRYVESNLQNQVK